MSGFTVFAIVLVVLALVGVALQKNGEFAGVGTGEKVSSLRAPHGRLVRTKRLDDFTELGFAQKFPRVLLCTFAVTFAIGALCVVGLLDFAALLPASLDLLAVVGVACALTQSDVGVWRSVSYALLGYLAGGVVATAGGLFAQLGTGAINALTMVFGTLGTSVAVAAMPLMRTYAREFADGHVNTIQVSSKSAAARVFDSVADASWKPPADRIADAQLGCEPRSFMEKRTKEK